MKELSNEASDLLARARPALRASPEQIERMRAGVAAKVAAGAATGASSAVVLKVILGGLGALALGAGIFLFASRPHQGPVAAPLPPATALVSAATERVVTSPPVASSVEPAPQPSAAPVVASPKIVKSAAPLDDADALAEESRLLREAQGSLRAGDAAHALALADRHIARFPRGVLRDEAHVTRVQALCALGRVADAKSELALVERTSPRSTALARARASCAATP